jgi:hypothetical protein
MKFQASSWIAVFLLIGAFVTACDGKSSKNEILTSRIQYDVPVVSNDPQLDWWINNIEGSRREPFLKRIMEAAEKGEVRVYDYFNKPLRPEQIISLGADTIYQTLMRTVPPYEEFDTMIVKSISYRDITKIRFLEEWKWNPESLEMEKKIIAIGPAMEREIGGEKFNQLLYWVSLDESFPGR